LCSWLAVLVMTGLVACHASGERRREPTPTPEYLAVRPQSVRVIPVETGDVEAGDESVDAAIRAQLRKELTQLGYRVSEPEQPADAEVRFFAEDSSTARTWYDGIAKASVTVRVEVWSSTGVFYESRATAQSREPGSQGEYEGDVFGENEDLGDVLAGMLLDPVFDAAVPPDYDELLRAAARDAAHRALAEWPRRMDPLSVPPAAGLPTPQPPDDDA
jgi:hypothetical protein